MNFQHPDDELDMADAVLFAEGIFEDAKRVSPLGGAQSVPTQRTLNLARCFLRLKYPFLCCGTPWQQPRCANCPMTQYDIEKGTPT